MKVHQFDELSHDNDDTAVEANKRKHLHVSEYMGEDVLVVDGYSDSC